MAAKSTNTRPVFDQVIADIADYVETLISFVNTSVAVDLEFWSCHFHSRLLSCCFKLRCLEAHAMTRENITDK